MSRNLLMHRQIAIAQFEPPCRGRAVLHHDQNLVTGPEHGISLVLVEEKGFEFEAGSVLGRGFGLQIEPLGNMMA